MARSCLSQWRSTFAQLYGRRHPTLLAHTLPWTDEIPRGPNLVLVRPKFQTPLFRVLRQEISGLDRVSFRKRGWTFALPWHPGGFQSLDWAECGWLELLHDTQWKLWIRATR